MTSHACVLLVLGALFAFSAETRCEDSRPLPSPFTLDKAVEYALAHQPGSRAGRAIEAGGFWQPSFSETACQLRRLDQTCWDYISMKMPGDVLG